MATPLVYINTGGNFIVAALVTQVFGLDNRVYGWIASLPAWCNAAQVALLPWLGRRFNSRQLAIGGAYLSAFAWGLIVLLLPWLPRDDAVTTARLLLVSMMLANLAQSYAAVGWNSWVQDWAPQRLRGKYFGARNRLSSLATVAYFLFVGLITERLTDGVWAYQIVFGVAVLMRLFSCTWQTHLVATPPENSHLMYVGWGGQMQYLAREKSFMRFAIYGAVAAFLINLTAPFYPVFAYEVLRMRVDQYSLLLLLSTLGAAAVWPWWGRFTDRHGCRNGIILSIALWSLTDLWWPFLRAGHAQWPLYIIAVWSGGAACGYLIGILNWLLKLAPVRARVAAVSFNLALTSLMAALAPVLAGSFLQAAHAAGRAELTFRGLFFAKPVLQMAALLLLRGVVEPEGTKLTALLGAMRTQRLVLVAQVLPFLANFQLWRGSGRGNRKR